VYHNYGEGIADTRGKNVIIRGNHSYDNLAVEIYIDNAITAVVDNNFVACSTGFEYGNGGGKPNGIAIGEESYSGWGAQLSDLTITNNIVAFCANGVTKWTSNVGGGLKGNNLIAFNTFWGPSGNAISFSHDGGDGTVHIANNIAHSASGKSSSIPSFGGMTVDHNFWVNGSSIGTNAKTGDVQFAKSPQWNDATSFRLSSSSPAIGAGVSIAGITTDFENKSRSGSADIGAIQFTGTIVPRDPPTPLPTTAVTPRPTPIVTKSPTSAPTPSPTALPQSCAADINGDRVIDLSDYTILVRDFLKRPPSNPKADFNRDGVVDLSDYVILVARFLKSC
jgi:hypothetical protein